MAMADIPSTISFHPSSLFTKPAAPAAPPGPFRQPYQTVEYVERCHSSDSCNSIDTEFTHFRPIRRAPVSGKHGFIARPTPVRSSTVSTCTLSTLGIGLAQKTVAGIEEDRIKQEKMDYELAWRIHKQEKRFMLRQTSSQNRVWQSPTRNRCHQMPGRRKEGNQQVEDRMCKEAIQGNYVGKMDYELAWRIHKQEKRSKRCQTSTQKQDLTRKRPGGGKQQMLDKM
jgi:hypothetical protein